MIPIDEVKAVLPSVEPAGSSLVITVVISFKYTFVNIMQVKVSK
jgi:hypothetical protein